MEAITAVRNQLEKAIASNELVRLSRDGIDARPLDAIPLEISASLVLLAPVEDWEFDGYAVARLDDITEVRSSEFERFTERVLNAEGLSVRKPSPAISVATWDTVFVALRTSAKVVLIREEAYEGEPMTVGAVVGFTDNAALVQYVDAVGEWDSTPSEVAFADITLVQFDDRYSTVFGRYVSASRPAI